MQPRHYLSDATGVVAPDEADLGSALAEGLETHQVVRVDHPAGDLPDRHVPWHPTCHTQDFRPQSHAVSHPSFIFSSIFLQATIRRRMVASLYLRLRSRAQYWRRSRSVRARTFLSRATAHSKMS